MPALLAKVARWRPRVICFNGKGIWLHVERSLQRQLVQSDGPDDSSAATGSRAVVPKRENEDLKPIIHQERPVKTEQATAWSKKDTPNDGVATESGVAAPEREAEEHKPSIADTDQEWPLRTKRERSASGASSTTANSSSWDAGRVLPHSNSTPVTMPVGRESAVASPSYPPITPRRTGTASHSTFVYGIQPYKTVHDVRKKKEVGLARSLQLTDYYLCSRIRQYVKRFSACFRAVLALSLAIRCGCVDYYICTSYFNFMDT